MFKQQLQECQITKFKKMRKRRKLYTPSEDVDEEPGETEKLKILDKTEKTIQDLSKHELEEIIINADEKTQQDNVKINNNDNNIDDKICVSEMNGK